MNEKINDLQNELKDATQKIWLAGIGAMTMAGEESSKLFKTLVEKGEEFESREKPPVDAAKRTVDSAKEKIGDVWGKFEDTFNEKVGIALQKLGVPTRDEINQLTERVDALMEAITKLSQDPTGSEKDAASK